MFTKNLEVVQTHIIPRQGDGKSVFPPRLQGIHEKKVRVRSTETVHDWFVRCVNDVLHGDPRDCTVEDNLALFLIVTWDVDRAISRISVQALCSEETLLDYYLDSTVPAQYLRLDYDPTALGPIFKEPLPHIHIKGDGEPRFAVALDSTGDALGAFFDFIYRNYYHAQWRKWAAAVWDDDCKRQHRPNAWERISAAYDAGKHQILENEFRQDLDLMKKILSEARGKFFPLRIPRKLCHLLSYPV